MQRLLLPVLCGLAAVFASSRAFAGPEEGSPTASEPTAIFGGEAVPVCGWPSVVSLGGCSASLIHPKVLLFAAHCGAGYGSVWFGETAFDGEGREVAIEYCEVNPAWTGVVGQGVDYAYCVLAEPVLDVPIIPVAAGCESTLLYPGRPVTQVGFGATEDGTSGIKHAVVNQVNLVDHGEMGTGGAGLDICYGDSGGPTFIRLPDGPEGEATYRQVGIHSWTLGCGNGSFATLAASALPWIEQRSGIDVTPCHSAAGLWHPGPTCGVVPLDPASGADTDWSRGCAGGAVATASSTCGPAFDAAEDLTGPTIAIVEPADRARLELPSGASSLHLTIRTDANDDISGVAAVRLVIEGREVEHGRLHEPPWQWDVVELSAGVWEIGAIAEDFAGNETLADTIVIGIDRDPPPAPIEVGSSEDSGGSSDSSSGSTSESTGNASSGSADESSSESTAAIVRDGGGDGCSCTSGRQPTHGHAAWSLFALLAIWPRRRTLRSVALVVPLALVPAWARAADDEAAPHASDPSPIYGGEAVPTCGWPAVVSLEGSCTANLIHPEVVLFAAHCGDAHGSVWFGETAYEGDGREVALDHCEVNPLWSGRIGEGTDYAYCVLAEPVLDIPVIPVAVGCEETLLYPGRPVTQVGFGWTDDEIYGVKHAVVTQLNLVDHGEIGTGSEGRDICNGDSGGPTFIRLPDGTGGNGTYRQVGIHSWGFACGESGSWSTLASSALPWIEQRTGIDVSPCHSSAGVWHPGPSCGVVPLDPESGAATDWSQGCGGGAMAEASATCGPAFDRVEDLVGPAIRIVEPADRSRIELAEGATQIKLVIRSEATDDHSGVAAVRLVIEGHEVEQGRLHEPPWQWDIVELGAGTWEIAAIAEDFAGNETLADAIVIGIDRDPPPAPAVGGSSSDGSESGELGDSTGDATSSSGSSESGPAIAETRASEGCGCTSGGGPARGLVPWCLSFGWIALRPRARRRVASLSLLLGVTACGDDGGPTPAATGSSESTSGIESGTESSSTTDGSTESSSSASSSTTAACPPGAENCSCTPEFTCDADLRCELDTCIACPFGSFGCPCRAEGETVCDGEGLCFSGYCAMPPACPFSFNGQCDEAPIGLCSTGTDPDCCAEPGDGVCDDMTRGGECLPGTDPFDCCATRGDGLCEEERRGGECPNGSDEDDCCAQPMNGACDEIGRGGTCLEGSDPFDCCAAHEDGVCEELSQGGACPDGSDAFDCCATRENGVCEELSQGGVCPDGSDVVDCTPAKP